MRFLLLLLLWPYMAWAVASDKPPFFQVSHNGHHAWLLGTIHVGRADFYPLPPQIEHAFAQAQILAFEANPHDPNLPELLMRYGRSDEPLPPSLQWQVSAHCQRLNMSCDLGLSPWLLGSQLAMVQFARAGYQAENGIEARLLAKNAERPLWQLESIAQQMAMFDGLSLPTQHSMLAASLVDDDPKPLIEAWRTGDLKSLEQLMRSDMADEPELWQTLITQRNQAMANTIATWLVEQKGLFIAVGAGHLFGEEGIPALLTQAGFTVKNCWQQHCE